MDAATWIGVSLGVKDGLDPTKIAAGLPPEAAVLGEMLSDSRVTNLAALRRQASNDARDAQRKFGLFSSIAVVGGAVAALASGVLLYGSGGDATGQQVAGSMIDWAAAHHGAIAVVQIAGLLAAVLRAPIWLA